MKVEIYNRGNVFEDMERLLPEAKLKVGRKRPNLVFVELSLYPLGSSFHIPGRTYSLENRVHYREGDCFFTVFSWLADQLHSQIWEIKNDFMMKDLEEFLLEHGMKEEDL